VSVKRSRTAVIALSVVGAVTMAGCGSSSGGSGAAANNVGGSSSQGDVQAVSIGAVLPMSGPYAQVGTETVQGLTMSTDECAAADGLKFDTHVEDGAATTSTAVAAYKKLVGQDHIKALIGPFSSGVAKALGPLTGRDSIVELLGGSAAPDVISASAPTVYRPNADNVIQGSATAEFAVSKLGWKKISIVYQETAFGQSLDHSASTTINQLGATVVDDLKYPGGNTNFASLVTKLKSSNIDGILFASLGAEAPALVRAVVQAGIPASHMLAFYADQSQIVSGLKDASGLMTLGYYDPQKPPNKNAAAFYDKYKAKYGKYPPLNASSGYLDGIILCHAVKSISGGQVTTEALLKAVANMKPFQGPYEQTIQWSHRQLEGDLIVLQYDGNKDSWSKIGVAKPQS